MAEFRMPSLGADMESGRVMKWFIKPGDHVKRGDIVAEVETQKGVIDVEIFDTGQIRDLLVQEGDEVPVGAALALLDGTSEPQIHEPESRPLPAAPPSETQPHPAVALPAAPEPAPRRARVSPAARRLAEELNVDLATVRGTGLDGAVTREDVRNAVLMAPPEAGEADQMAAMRDVIAAAMARSKREIPHYYLGTDIDLSRALTWMTTENQRRSVTDRLLPAVLLIKAVATALDDVPELNGFWLDGAFRPSAAIHVGVAISLRQGGLIAPALHDVRGKQLTELMTELRDLVQRARTGKLKSSELSDATITVSNLGDQGVDAVYGVIYPPQVALVGFGTIRERPWAENGMLGVRPAVTATLSADHRASVGHRGGRFLAKLAQVLQKPEEL